METTLCFAKASALEAVDVDLINTHGRTNLSPAMAFEAVGWSTAVRVPKLRSAPASALPDPGRRPMRKAPAQR